GVRRNADGTSIQFVVGFRPLLLSHVASEIRGSVSVTRGLVASRKLIYSFFCCTSTSQRRFADSSCDSL
ncbi:hypothetical protein HAX54_042237, partial [Datura stramonium]|nr:hypothetical protein [Datura stramonium]